MYVATTPLKRKTLPNLFAAAAAPSCKHHGASDDATPRRAMRGDRGAADGLRRGTRDPASLRCAPRAMRCFFCVSEHLGAALPGLSGVQTNNQPPCGRTHRGGQVNP
jgi:hypothetical protein